MLQSLDILCGMTDLPMVNALYGHALGLAMDAGEMERLRIRRHIFLARYGRQSMLQWDQVEGRLVRRYANELAEFLIEEAKAMPALSALQQPHD